MAAARMERGMKPLRLGEEHIYLKFVVCNAFFLKKAGNSF